MADVYRAVHLGREPAPVAVKVITGSFAHDPRFVASLENEVRAVARLDHPGIVRVFDYGKVDEAAVEASRGTLAAGSPYLVMELATGGTLARMKAPLGFLDTYPILRLLLAALAHAHARGVVHRDLKPDNVLIATNEDLRPGMKLTDFGIAKAHEADASEAGGGTPAFMAPEQFFGRRSDAGPWTDLYALGCLAYLMSSGRLPFSGNVAQLALAHTGEDPPPLALGESYPDDFPAWVRCLLSKEPRDRFQRAADAATELQAIARRRRKARTSFRPSDTGRISDMEVAMSPSGLVDLLAEEKTVLATGDHARPSVRSALVPSSTHLETLPAAADRAAVERWRAAVLKPRARPTSGIASTRAPFPASWREHEARERRLDLAGVGLGLFGLREVPMVGRDDARDRLWSELGGAVATSGPRVAIVRAEAGQGKTRLVEWLAALGHEVGAATILRATHGEVATPMDGLPRMLARHLSVVGLSPPDTLLRVQDWLRARGIDDEHEALTLAELISPTAGKQLRFREAKERHRLVDRVLDLEARERAVVLFVDDAQWGLDALDYVAHLLSRETRPKNVLVAIAVRSDLVEARKVELEKLETLARDERASTLELAPLGEREARRLVEELLGLDAELARKVVERASGNPMFAVQLVGDWVQRGVLAPTAAGFSLARPEELDVPDDVYQLWSVRLSPIVRGRPGCVRALAIAAILGRDVIEEEWLAVCGRAESSPPGDLLDALLREGLALRSEGGWSFSHVLLRESIVRAAKRSSRFAELSAIVGELLAERAAAGARVAERAGRHLADAGKDEEAARWLLAGARERWYLSDYSGAAELIDARERVLARSGHDGELPLVDGWLLHAELCLRLDEIERAVDLAERAERASHLAGERRALGEARRLLACAAYQRGDMTLAKERFERALATFAGIGDGVGEERCRVGLGDVAYRMGDLEEAGKLYAKALGPLEALGAVEYVADALYGLGYVAMWRRRLDHARQCFLRELEIFEALGDRFGIGRVSNSLGEVARLSERWDEAESRYRKTLKVCEALDLPRMRSVVLINLGLVLMAVDKDDEADPLIREGYRALIRSGSRSDEAAVLGAVLAMDAHSNDWERWDVTFKRLVELVEETKKADGDLAWELEQAARRAFAREQAERGRCALELARDQWVAIGRPDAAHRITAQLRG